ncbi:hypothetical protein HU200_030380 [Digitaria exilis]|uniref:Saccharopine dehydrogenase NADP binding domain-containing protein n=1 Tax=Digitaria exilis TaxID=1010633 RepID=A0A835EQV4_9POAL|nr:hypothetical protein HU200_030380 [Digitaria exilis]
MIVRACMPLPTPPAIGEAAAKMKKSLRSPRVLVLGGTGRVGWSTATALSKLRPDLNILIGGRNQEKVMAAELVHAAISEKACKPERLRNLPEVKSAFKILDVPTVSARFGSDPFFWNWGMHTFANFLPTVDLEYSNGQNIFGLFTHRKLSK